MKFSTTKKCATEFLVIGIGLFLLCLALILIFPRLYLSQLHKQLTLVEGSTSYPMWQDIPLPIYERLYFFNITNAQDFVRHGAKLKVEQVGPYTYKGKWVKNPVAWNPNTTVSYREIRTYHFVPDQSSGSEDDVIYTLNAPMIAAANILKNVALPLKLLLSIFLGIENEQIVTQRTIRELGYGGYYDPVMEYAVFAIPGLPYKNGIFSWLYGKNGTDDGMFTVFTGERDIQSLNVINKWNGNENLGFWSGDTCNMINGSSGEMGPPLTDGQQSYTIFQSIFCRTLTFSYSDDQAYMGLKPKRFVSTDKVFANATDNPDNYCFQTSEFMPSGVQDISDCQYGTPVFLSFPHFYLADPAFLDLTDGLKPEEKKHSSYIDVEPITGIATSLKIRFQINLKLEKLRGLLQFQHIPDGLGIYPVFWVEIDVAMTNDLAKFLLDKMDKPKTIFYSLVGLVMAISVVMIIGAIVVLCRLPRKEKDDDDPLLNPDEHKEKNGKRKLCQEKPESNGGVNNYVGCFGDSSPESSPKIKAVTNSVTFEDDVKMLDAAGASEQSDINHKGFGRKDD